MKDKEFSRPRAEFSPAGREFAPPAAEFAPPGREHHRAGPEFVETAAPPPAKKRRGVNPLMLTTAAVVTASVVLTSTPVVEFFYPKKALGPEHRALMTTLDTALVDQDISTLLEISEDDRLRDFLMDVVEPYFQECQELERQADEFYYTYWSPVYEKVDQGDYSDEVYSADITFDGTSIGPRIFYEEEDPMFFLNQYDYTYREGTIGGTRKSTYITREDPHEAHDETVLFGEQSFQCSYNREGELFAWNLSDYQSRTAKHWDGQYEHYYNIPQSGILMEYYQDEFRTSLIVKEGSFVNEWNTEDDGHFYNFLENGTVTVYHKNAGTWEQICVIEVVDGVTQLNDRMIVEPIKYSGGTTGYQLEVRLNTGLTMHLYTEDGQTLEDFLYHTFTVY